MYAIIESGGKQHKVTAGDILQVEKLDADVGTKVEFNKVLLIAKDEHVTIGTPCVAGAKVCGEIVEQGRLDKIDIVKFRRRKHFLKRAGHRQYFTAVKVDEIVDAAA